MNLDKLYKDDAKQLYGGKTPHRTHMQREYLLKNKTQPHEFTPKLLNRSINAVVGQGINELLFGATDWGDTEVKSVAEADDKLNEICGKLIADIKERWGDPGVAEFRKNVIRFEEPKPKSGQPKDGQPVVKSAASQVGKIDLKKIQQAVNDMATIKEFTKRISDYEFSNEEIAKIQEATANRATTSALPRDAVALLCAIELMLGAQVSSSEDHDEDTSASSE